MNVTQYKNVAVAVLVGMAILVQGALGAEQSIGMIPNDPLFPLQWHLYNTGQSGGTPGVDINAIKAGEITTGDPSIIIAIIGEGIDLDHPDLVNNLVPGIDFWDQDDSPYPSGAATSEYETGSAGLIAAEGNNGIGVTGVTWHCKIMPVRAAKVTRADWSSWVSAANEAGAYRWAAAHGADILMCGSTQNGPAAAVVRSALIDITRPGGIGRNGKGCLYVTPSRSVPSIAPGYIYYGAHPETISVDAVDPCDRLWWAHEAGSRVDLVAPSGCAPRFCGSSAIPMWTTDITGPLGANTYSTSDKSILDYSDAAGAPCSLVAGVAALILSVEPNLTSDEVRHYLCRSAHDLGEPGRDDLYGWGRVDARAALDMVLAKRADLNNDWKVDERDLAILNAAINVNDLSADVAPAAKRDGIVDVKDQELLMQYLGTKVPEFGLLAHWKLDETEGEIAHGSATTHQGVTHDGALFGLPTWQPAGGEVDGALLLDGVDDYVGTPFLSDRAAGPFSVFAWVQGGAPGQVILSQQGTDNWLMLDSAGRLVTELKPPRGRPLASQAVITDGKWHRVGLVWDGALRTLYVDGVEVARDENPRGNLTSSNDGLYIGTAGNLAPATFWSGLIDDVRIYDRAVKP